MTLKEDAIGGREVLETYQPWAQWFTVLPQLQLVSFKSRFSAGEFGTYYPPEEQQLPKVDPAQPIRSQ
jgi:hypothetical protein